MNILQRSSICTVQKWLMDSTLCQTSYFANVRDEFGLLHYDCDVKFAGIFFREASTFLTSLAAQSCTKEKAVEIKMILD